MLAIQPYLVKCNKTKNAALEVIKCLHRMRFISKNAYPNLFSKAFDNAFLSQFNSIDYVILVRI